ncbi:phospholipase A1 member A isoform X4 [Erinaceus europaeus]|uniref:Phospholipase A1 member A n=1 Tax=Erinaceus europaeus TaxID=9365 RepID=A0A1S3WML9_ERIEU|nr:phospholipase A1 member A isoform X4 [Erinaceus europaeus]
MPPGLWGGLLWWWWGLLTVGSSGDSPPILQPKCTDFQKANLLRGTNLKVQFLLFTPSNPSCGQLLEESSDIQNSGFNATLGTKLIIHGFRALGTKPSWIDTFIGAILRAADVNVIAVDWVYGSTAVYFSAVENVVKLGLEISSFLRKLLVLGMSESSIHIIGISLGAHVGGMVGHFYKGQLGRITGYSYLICDHMRAVHLYISALENSCPLMAFPCASYKAFLAGHCVDCFTPFLLSCPRIGLAEQGGIDIKPLPKEVSVYLLTTSMAPYCVHHSLVEFYLLQPRNKDTTVDVTFLSSNATSSVKITIPKQQLQGKGIIAHSNPQCQINQVKFKLKSSRVWRKEWTTIVGKFCTAPLPINDNNKMVCLPESVKLQSSMTVYHDLSITCT